MTARPAVVLLGSPLLGPSVWTPVRDVLRAAGWNVRVLTSTAGSQTTPTTVLDDFLANLPQSDFVLVAHSNAGAYVPALAATHSPLALVFVDAILPPEKGRIALAPAAMMDALGQLSGPDGLLPSWTEWFDVTAVAALFPNDEVRRRIESEQPHLPLDYFSATLPVPAGWDARPRSYIAFGATYRSEVEEAMRRGWSTRVLDGGHLHMLVSPAEVADAIATEFRGSGVP